MWERDWEKPVFFEKKQPTCYTYYGIQNWEQRNVPHLCFRKVLLVSLLSGKTSMRRANREKPHTQELCSFMSSLCACPASSALIEGIFSTYGLVWCKIRKSLDAEMKQKNCLKYTDCAELKKITIRTVPFILHCFSQVLWISLLFVLFD